VLSQVAAHDPSRFGKVVLLMGGLSAEREISLRSGAAILEALKRKGVDAIAIDVGEDVIVRLQEVQFDRAFIILHGRGGEDGVIQGVLEIMGIPFTGSGVMASALGMDKLRTKQLWQGIGLPTPPFMCLQNEEDLESLVETIGLPVFVKPAHEGSSVGMTKVSAVAQLKEAWTVARKYDQDVLAERWIEGDEYTVTILGDMALPPIRIETPREFYDFEAKYHADTTSYHCPSGLGEDEIAELQALALRAFAAVGCQGWGRVDFMRDHNNRFWLIEVNTVPGMTDHSLVPMAAKAAGIDFDELVCRILDETMGSTYAN
jgi:D-alanine-D-alanine ligase